MKVSSILLAALFTGLVGHLGDEGVLDRHRVKHGGIRYDAGKKECEELKQLKAREAEVRQRIREVENGIRKIESSERYISSRLGKLERQICSSDRRKRRGVLESMEVNAAEYERQLDVLEEEKYVFIGYLERLGGELATLKVKIDLFDLAESRVHVEDLLGGEERSPVEELKAPRRYAASHPAY